MFNASTDVRYVSEADMNLASGESPILIGPVSGWAHLVLNEDCEKLRGLRFAGVATYNVNVIGTFIEGLTRVKGDRLRPLTCMMTEPSST